MAMSEEISAPIPNLKIAKWIFQLQKGLSCTPEGLPLTDLLLQTLTEGDMSGFYQYACSCLNWPTNDALLSQMRRNNEEFLGQLEGEIEFAEGNLGDVELKKLVYKKAKYFCSIGEREKGLETLAWLVERANTVGQNLQYNFLRMRVGLFFLEEEVMRETLERLEKFVEEAGDWEQRNRLKIYRGLFLLTVRDFGGAAASFMDGMATYTSSELMDFAEFVVYTILCYVLVLDRSAMKKSVIRCSDVQEALFGLPLVRCLFYSFYNCRYAELFRALAQIETFMKDDRYLSSHYSYYISQVKLKAYKQLLESYSSLSINYMADLFGVTPEYVDSELSMYVGCGKLQCTINKVEGVVETTTSSDRNANYNNIIRIGDKLLNRMQKLSRVINL